MILLNQTGTLLRLSKERGEDGSKAGDWETHAEGVACNYQVSTRLSGLKATERGQVSVTYYTGFYGPEEDVPNGYRFRHDQLGLTFLIEHCSDPTGLGHHQEAKALQL